MAETVWLIEVGLRPVLYYSTTGDWCSNANHAHKFGTASEAQMKVVTMQGLKDPRVVEHRWDDEP